MFANSIPVNRAYMQTTRVALVTFAKAMTLGLLILGTSVIPLAAAPVPVRFSEGATHGFLVLRTVDGAVIAEGELLQVARGGQVEKRMVFHFKDGSVFEEKAAFTQQHVYAMQSYSLAQRGAAFSEDIEILERASGTYRVKSRAHNKDARENVVEGKIDLPSDVYNGMILTVAKDLNKGASETIHVVAFMPEPRLIELELAPAGEHKVLVGNLARTAIHYVFKPQLGMWLKLFATVLGRLPSDYHVWIVTNDVPAFVRFEGPLTVTGPVWRIELTSPRWPE